MKDCFDVDFCQKESNVCTMCEKVVKTTSVHSEACEKQYCSTKCLALHRKYCGLEKHRVLCDEIDDSMREIYKCLDIVNLTIDIDEFDEILQNVAKIGVNNYFLTLKNAQKLNSNAISLFSKTTGCGTAKAHFLRFAWKKALNRSKEDKRSLELAALAILFGLRITAATVLIPIMFQRPAVEMISFSIGTKLTIRTLSNVGKTFSLIWKRDRDNKCNDIAYLFYYYSRFRSPNTSNEATGGYGEVDIWNDSVLEAHPLEHYFFVRVLGDSFVIVQSFYGYYTADAWLDWENDLQRSSEFPNATVKGSTELWHHPLEKRPRFRGLLSVTKDGKDFSRAVDRIAEEHSLDDYRDITGVAVRKDCKASPLYLAVVRLQL